MNASQQLFTIKATVKLFQNGMSRIKPLFNDSLFIFLLTAQFNIFVLLKSPESGTVPVVKSVNVAVCISP